MKSRKLFAVLLSLCMVASTIVALPVSAETEYVIDINLPFDDINEITWIASSAVTVSNADGIGGRNNVIKAEGLTNSNNNTAGVKFPDGFSFAEGDILTYSIDVYSETALNPDMWIRNHQSSLSPVATFYHEKVEVNTWTTITRTLTYEDMVNASLAMNSSGAFDTAGNYAIYVRPRSAGTLYFDNFRATVEREVVERTNVIEIEVDSASEITWISTDAVKVSDANGIGGRDNVIKMEGLANSNDNTAGVVLGKNFAFRESDIITYSFDVYSETALNPDIWIRNHGSSLSPFATFFSQAIKANEWTTVTRDVSYAELSAERTGWENEDKYALYFRPRNGSVMYVDNFKVTISRAVGDEPEKPVIEVDYSKYETTILSCTDFQNQNGNEDGALVVTDIVNVIAGSGLNNADAFFCCGDYQASGYGTATEEGVNALKSAVIDFVPDEESHIYIQGNHDAEIGTQGLAKSGNNDPESGDYGVFVINEDDYMWYNSDLGRIMETAENLAGYLNEKLVSGYEKPIFVLSHLPLYKSLRTTNDGDAQHANQLFHVLNKAGEQGLNIIYMYGHDHSSGYDSYLGGSATYLKKGDSINIPQGNKTDFKAETLNFTYMNAGYVGYYATGTDRDSTLNMTLTCIDEDTDTVDVYRFDRNGLHNLKSAGVLKTEEKTAGEYEADTRIYTSPQTIASTKVDYKYEIKTLTGEGRETILKIDLPLDNASELTWVASDAVTVSTVDGIGGRDKVIKAEGLANSNDNTVGVKLPDGFAFCEGDILTYSVDVYSESAINPDLWLRNHSNSLNPFATFYEQTMGANAWKTIRGTITYDELNAKVTASGSSGSFDTAGNYAFYLRPRSNATVYLDNIKVTVSRLVLEETYIPGDVDGNGEVVVRDVIFLRRYIAGGYDITVNEAALDIDRDGEVVVRDVITLRRFIAGGYGIELK